jgi:hypothetical protein
MIRIGTGIRGVMMGIIEGKGKKINSLACAGDNVIVLLCITSIVF